MRPDEDGAAHNKLLFIHNAGWPNFFDRRSESFQGLGLLLRDVIGLLEGLYRTSD